MVVEAYEGFQGMATDAVMADLPRYQPLPCLLIRSDGAITWRNPAASAQLPAERASLLDVVADPALAHTLLKDTLSQGDCITDLLIRGKHCQAWHRVTSRRVSDPESGHAAVLATLTPICDLRGCTRLQAAPAAN